MKHNFLNIKNNTLRVLFTTLAMGSLVFMAGCDDDDPEKENVPELITKVTLTFTPIGGGTTVEATATDPDGEGVQELTVDGPINLATETRYTMTIELINGLLQPTDDEYFITEEVEEEADEHMFFFAWTNNVFDSPSGNGNVDNRADAVNYNDEDGDGLPLGLSTDWTTASAPVSGTFRVILKHQPDLKSATSTADTGETDVDITFDIDIE